MTVSEDEGYIEICLLLQGTMERTVQFFVDVELTSLGLQLL